MSRIFFVTCSSWTPEMPHHLSIALHWLHFRVTTCRYAQKFHRSYKAEHVKQAIEEVLNSCEIDKQRLQVILRDNVRNVKKTIDDMEVPNASCVLHTLQLADHEGLLSQCSFTDSPANARKMVGQYWNVKQNKKEPNKSIYFVSTK